MDEVSLTIETFEGRIGETFRMVVDEWEIPMRLSNIDKLSMRPDGSRGFALHFHAPPQIVLRQQLFGVEHDELPPFTMFLVPLGPDEHGMRYEAVIF